MNKQQTEKDTIKWLPIDFLIRIISFCILCKCHFILIIIKIKNILYNVVIFKSENWVVSNFYYTG